MASVANAAEPTPADAVTSMENSFGGAPAAVQVDAGGHVSAASAADDEMTAQGTQRFTITNLSGRTLTIADIWGTTGWPQPTRSGFDIVDQFPLTGSVLKPGDRMTLEIRDWSNHGITVKFKADNGRDAYVYMHVSGVSRYSDAQGLAGDGQFLTGGGDITFMDRPGSVQEIPASNTSAQSQAVRDLCDNSSWGPVAKPNQVAVCSFSPNGIEGNDPLKPAVYGPKHPVGDGIANLTEDPQTRTFRSKDVVGTTHSLEISASVKATIFKVVETSLTTTYGHTWSSSHEFEQSQDLLIRPGRVGWLEAAEPVVRVTGDVTITLPKSGAKWILKGVTFDLPNNERQGLVYAYSRPMTDQEIADAWSRGGIVHNPWDKGGAGVTVEQVLTSGDVIDLDGVDVPA